MNEVDHNILNDFIEPPRPANIGKRILAAIIDMVILLLLFLAFTRLWGHHSRETITTTSTTVSTSDAATPQSYTKTTSESVVNLGGWASLGYMVAWFLLMPVLEGKFGQTVGKMIVQVKVIRQDGEPATIGLSFVRHLLDFVDCFCFIGLIIAVTNDKRTRIGDMAAKTYVVEKTA